MRTSRGLRLILTGILVLCGLTATGCGQMARQAIKDGLFGYVSGNFASGVVSAQLADFVTSFFTKPTSTPL